MVWLWCCGLQQNWISQAVVGARKPAKTGPSIICSENWWLRQWTSTCRCAGVSLTAIPSPYYGIVCCCARRRRWPIRQTSCCGHLQWLESVETLLRAKILQRPNVGPLVGKSLHNTPDAKSWTTYEHAPDVAEHVAFCESNEIQHLVCKMLALHLFKRRNCCQPHKHEQDRGRPIATEESWKAMNYINWIRLNWLCVVNCHGCLHKRHAPSFCASMLCRCMVWAERLFKWQPLQVRALPTMRRNPSISSTCFTICEVLV